MLEQTRLKIVPMNAPDATDDELIARMKADPAAFGLLYCRYLDSLYRYHYARVGSKAEAEDLTSQVFLAALEGLAGYHSQGHFPAWLFSIARRKIADHYRGHRPQAPLELASNLTSPGGDLLAQVLQAEELASLQDQLALLAEDNRELLRLRFAARLNFSEMTTVLGRSESSVKMAFYRLLQRLQKQLEVNHD
jgi:RNA polymerase sigma-70 factor (ECF subfamily)